MTAKECPFNDTAESMKDDKQIKLLEIFENGTIKGSVTTGNEISATSGSEKSLLSINLGLNSIVTLSESICGSYLPSTARPMDGISELNLRVNTAIPDTNFDDVVQIAQQFRNAEVLSNNSDTCSQDSRANKRLSTKMKRFRRQTNELNADTFPPAYTTIFVDTESHPAAFQSSSDLRQIRSFEGGGHLTLSVPVIHRRYRHSERQSNCCTKLFRGPSLAFVIGILALGGVTCTLGGIVLGSTGLVDHSTQYLSAALLMIGIGVSLLIIAGAIWRLSIPDENETCTCFRPRLETCRNCNNPFCGNGLVTSGYTYPEFQHRAPPPSYLTSLQECSVGVLLREPSEQQPAPQSEVVRNTSPPPSYRSCSVNSLR